MRRAAALVLRALPTGGLRPQQRPSPASTAAAAARAFGTWPGAPGFGAPPPRLARPGEYLTGVAHSTQWRVGHRFTVHVEYDTKDVDHFLELADALEEALPDVQVEGNVPGVHPRCVTLGALLAHKLRSLACRLPVTQPGRL